MTRLTLPRIRDALQTIGTHYPATLVPVTRKNGSQAAAAAFAALPVSADVLDKRDLCRQRLAGWCWVTIRDRELRTENLMVSDVAGMVEMLGRHADWLADRQDAGEVVTQLEGSARDLTSIAAPHRREWMSLGACPLVYDVDGEPVGCSGVVRAYPECDPYCDGCGVEAVVSWWERKMFPDAQPGRLVTAAEMVTVIHREFGRVVVESTIRKWASRGFIAASGTDGDGRSLYDLGGVVYALARRNVTSA